jgi:heme oxygenase
MSLDRIREVTPVSEVLAALRAATKERHEIIDRSMPLSRADPTLADYIDHIRLMRAWLHPLECWLYSSAYSRPSSPQLLQTALIDADLVEAGRPFEPEPASTANKCWADDADAAYRWGARYVIEGSRLGAAVLFRRLANTLRPHTLRYLQYGSGASGERWQKFLRELRAGVQTSSEIEKACEGARASFDALLSLRARYS